MALPQGLNFRTTLGYVTDPATDYCMADGVVRVYPVTSTQGNTVGYESPVSVQIRDRSSSNPARLAGMHYHGSGLVQTVRIDLPSAGDYNVRLAAGDQAAGWTVKAELFDDTTSLGVLANGTTSTNTFRDATNTNLTAANWVTSNTAVTKTFSSTICRIKYGNGSSISPIAHFYIEAASGGSASYTITPTGSVSLFGTSTVIKNRVYAISGSVSYSGSAPLSTQAATQTYTISPTGSITYSGTYISRSIRTILPTGLISLSGNGIINYTYVHVVEGNITFSGSAPLYVPGSYIPTTSILLTGVGN